MKNIAVCRDERMIGFAPQDIDRAARFIALGIIMCEQRSCDGISDPPSRLVFVQRPLK